MKHTTAQLDRSAQLARLASRIIPVGVIAAAAAFLSVNDVRQLEAQTSGGDGYDTDGDGLPDRQEMILRTSANSADTDGDGFDDGIEFARQSDPTDENSIPTSGLSVKVEAYATAGQIHLITAVYAPDGLFGNKSMRLGLVANDRPVALSPERMNDVRIVEHGRLRVIDWAIPAGRVQQLDRVSFAVAVGWAREPHFESAAVVNLRISDRIVMWQGTDAATRGGDSGGGSGDFHGLSMSSGPGGTSTGSLPLPSGGGRGGGSLPREWTAGAICQMTTTTIGTGQGGMLEQEVTSAECVDGFDSSCDSDCENQVGRTFSTIDPVVLIGG